MTAVIRVPVSALQPGDEARATRTATPYTVAAIAVRHDAWAVLGCDGVTRHYSTRAWLWRTDQCAGQTALLDPQEAASA